VEACREPAFGVTRPAAPTEQRDRFRPPELTLDELAAEGRTGLPILGFDRLRVSARRADLAASADRTLRTRARFPAVSQLGAAHVRCPARASGSKAEPTVTKRTLRGLDSVTGRDGPVG